TVNAVGSNNPPSASAGPNRTVQPGDTVTLAGTASDPDGDPLVYSWSKTGGSGPDVALSDPASLTPSFVAVTPGSYQFSLSVSDNHGGFVAREVTITVNASPVANAGPDRTVNLGGAVQLAGSGQDADSETLTYAWSYVSGPAQQVV